MRFVDPLQLRKAPLPKSSIIFAASQMQGERDHQEDYFLNFNDECFVVTDGLGGIPHGEVAAKLAAETAIWGYKEIRLRRCYWLDKKMFMKRIFRSVNLAVWQKRRESGFEEGLATTLLVLMTGNANYWLGSIGDSRAYLLRDGELKLLTSDDTDKNGLLTQAVGFKRLGLVPHFIGDKFKVGDILLLASDGLTHCLGDQDIKQSLMSAGDTPVALTENIVDLLKKAQRLGSTDNMTACVIKKASTVNTK